MDALNYTSRAIDALNDYGNDAMPLSTQGFRYIRDKLRAAQVFVLPDHGELFDRSKPNPEVPGEVFRPPFPVVAIEYTARDLRPDMSFYTETRCSRRIALAFDWQNDMPAALRGWVPAGAGPGVVVASVAYYDDLEAWMPVAGMAHIAYDFPWVDGSEYSAPFREAAIASGRVSKAAAAAKTIPAQVIPLLPEVVANVAAVSGGPDAACDMMLADLMDEVNAYRDLCYALACRNVQIQNHPAPVKLNRARAKAGRPPLPDHHTLILSDGAGGTGEAFGGLSAGPRSHLRRGHIRRLSADRITWVNQTIVHGRGGFVDKTYSMGNPA